MKTTFLKNEPDEPPSIKLCNYSNHCWLTYQQAAEYTGWSVKYLRNLVSSNQIPVYGRLYVRRFKKNMLDKFLTNPDVAMRKFRLERNAHGN